MKISNLFEFCLFPSLIRDTIHSSSSFIINLKLICKESKKSNIVFYLILPSIFSLIFVYIVLHRIEKSLVLLHYTVTPVAYSLYITVIYKLYATGVTV